MPSVLLGVNEADKERAQAAPRGTILEMFWVSNLLVFCFSRTWGFPAKPKPGVPEFLQCVNGRSLFGGQAARGYPKAFPRLRLPLFAVPALREHESACRVSIL